MKNTPVYFIACLFIVSLLAGNFDFQFHKNAKKEVHKKGSKGEPGWYQQYYRMKKNEQGIIPSGALLKAYREARAKNSLKNRSGSSNLKNIQELGPSNVGGRTRALVVDRSNSSHLIAGGISGGVWNSYDAGQSWQAVNDFSATLSVSCMTQDYFDPNIIYYGTGEGAGNSADINGAGIFKSTDGGQTFQQLASTTTNIFSTIWSIKADPSRANVVYAGTKSYGLRRSTDGGSSFRSVFNNGQVQDVEALPDGKVFFTMNASGIYKSFTGDSGTFSKLSGGLPVSGFQRIEIASCASNPAVLYAAFQDNGSYYSSVLGVYKSTDTGTTWADVTNDFDTNGGTDFPWYCFTMSVKPDNANVVYVGSILLRYSTNGGNSWKNAEDTHADNHTIVFDPNDAGKVYIGNDGGLYRFNNSLLAFGPDNLNNNYNVTQFYAGAYFPSGYDFYAGTQDNGTQARRGASSYTNAVYWGDGAFTQINQQNADIAFVSSQNGDIAKTTNASSTFPFFSSAMNELDDDFDGNVDDNVWFINPFEMNRLDGQQLYFITQERVWLSTNGADNWQPLTNFIGSGYDCYEAGISNELNPTVYVGGNGGLFYRIDNAPAALPGDEIDLSGSLPFSISSGFIGCLTVHPNNNAVVYVSFSNFSSQPRVWKVTNAKSASPQWTSISGDLPSNLPVNWIEVDPWKPDSVFFIGTDIGLFSTNNGGQNWVYEDAVIPHVPVMNIRMRYTDGRLFVFTHGRGAFSADLLESGLTEKSPAASSFGIYPNPAENMMQLEFPRNINIEEIKIFNAKGELVLSQTVKNNFAAKQLDISSLEKGAYFIQVKSQGGKSAKKFVKF